MIKIRKIVIPVIAALLGLGAVSLGVRDTAFAGEAEKQQEEDLNGLPVTPDKEEDANSWRYINGERAEKESSSPVSLFSAFSLSASAEDFVGEAFGIDVSRYQGEIDWTKAGSEIDFAIIRCGYGGNYEDQDDAYFEANATACEELGIPYGVYLYSYATDTVKARSEAEHVLRMIGNHTPALPVYLDLEDTSIIAACTDEEILEIATVFCETLEDAGFEVGIYANLDWWNTHLTDNAYDSWDRWVAQWGDSCTYSGDYSFWQYTAAGTVSGISGYVDCDYAMRELSEISGPVYVEDELYTGYYMDRRGRLYTVTNGVKTLKSGTVSAGAEYYSYNDGKFMTLAKQTVFVRGNVYSGYYTDSSSNLYTVSNGTRTLKSGTVSAGAKYYSYNSGTTQTLSTQTVYVNGKVYTGYYMDSSNNLYTVSKGIRTLKSGTVGAGAKYYSYNSGTTQTLSTQTVYVNGKVYTGYYMDSSNNLYTVSKGIRTLKSGTVSAGAKYYSYNSGTTQTLSKQMVYVNGKVYTGYYMDSSNNLYTVSKGTRTLKSGTVSAGAKYYSYNGGTTRTLSTQTVYVNGKVYTGYYMDSSNKMYKVTNGTRTLLTATLKKGTSYYNYNSGKILALSKNTVYRNGKA